MCPNVNNEHGSKLGSVPRSEADKFSGEMVAFLGLFIVYVEAGP